MDILNKVHIISDNTAMDLLNNVHIICNNTAHDTTLHCKVYDE